VAQTASQAAVYAKRLMVGIFMSVCKILLGIYHGAFTIARRTLFWYLPNIAMFELLAVPQRVTPYVKMGVRIFLYMSNLFSIDNSDFLPRIQYKVYSLEFRPQKLKCLVKEIDNLLNTYRC
jgi:hypothetical protein